MSTKPLEDCSGCTDPRSEGTHQEDTKQHPRPEPQQQSWEERIKNHEYAVGVKLLARFYDLYKAGRKAGAPQGFIDFFRSEQFLLVEVENALEKAHEEATLQERTRIVKLVEKHLHSDPKGTVEQRNGFFAACNEILKDLSTNENGV